MRSLLRAVFLLTLILCLTLATIIGLSYRDPSQNRWAYLFTNPDGSRCETACLLGVDLTKQTFEEADLLLSKHPALIGAERKSAAELAGEFELEDDNLPITVYKTSRLRVLLTQNGVQTPEPDFVSNVLTIKFLSDTPKLSDIILNVGAPVDYKTGSDDESCRLVALHMPKGTYALFTSDEDGTCLRIDQKVDVISIFNHPEFEQGGQYYVWSGFNQNRNLNAVQQK